jgi:ATP-dependent Clp protease ATP-binding subunit ClpA
MSNSIVITAADQTLFDILTKNLIQEAKEGLYSEVFGRENEIQEIVQVLSRQQKNNAILLGPEGCGKSSIVQLLAQKMLHSPSEFPANFPKRLYSLNISMLTADQMQGAFALRVACLLKMAKHAKTIKSPFILFIDEIHSAIDVGSDNLKFVELVKDALARGGELNCIGATTDKDFQRKFGKEPAFSRRFRPVRINPPSSPTTLFILRSVKRKWEKDHQCRIPDDTLQQIVKLADRYLPHRYFPDKAFDLLDESCSYLKTAKCSHERSGSIALINEQLAYLNAEENSLNDSSAANDHKDELKDASDSICRLNEIKMKKRDLEAQLTTLKSKVVNKLLLPKLSYLEQEYTKTNQEWAELAASLGKTSESVEKSIEIQTLPKKPPCTKSDEVSQMFINESKNAIAITKKPPCPKSEEVSQMFMNESKNAIAITKKPPCTKSQEVSQMFMNESKNAIAITNNSSGNKNDAKDAEIIKLQMMQYILNSLSKECKDGQNKNSVELRARNLMNAVISFDSNLGLKYFEHCTSNFHVLALNHRELLYGSPPFIEPFEQEKKQKSPEQEKEEKEDAETQAVLISITKQEEEEESMKSIILLEKQEREKKRKEFITNRWKQQAVAKIKEKQQFVKPILTADQVADMYSLSAASLTSLPELQARLDSLKTQIEVEKIPLLLREHVADIVSKWTGIPVSKMNSNDKADLLLLEQRLKLKVVGQDDAITNISNAIRRSRLGLGAANQPIGSFLFLGGSGCGKTSCAKALAAELFHDEKQFTRIDMSEFSEAFKVSRLTGSPPGYVQSENGGELTNAVLKYPYSVVLLDEVEKAHPKVLTIFLQVMDEGRLTDGRGTLVDFRNTVLIFTSNIGNKTMMNKINQPNSVVREEVTKELKEAFPIEFLNRFDDITFFNVLQDSHFDSIFDIKFDEINQRLLDQKVKLECTLRAKRIMLKQVNTNPEFGARALNRYLSQTVLNPLAKLIIQIPSTQTARVFDVDWSDKNNSVDFIERVAQ